MTSSANAASRHLRSAGPRFSRRLQIGSVGLLVALLGGIASYLVIPALPASASITWSSTGLVDTVGPPFGTSLDNSAIACDPTATNAADTLCVAPDLSGGVASTTNPAGGATAWSRAEIDSGHQFDSASCVSATFCMLGDSFGDVWTSTNPTGGVGAWTESLASQGIQVLALSCPSTSLCVAAGGSGAVITTTNPTATTPTWTKVTVDGTHQIVGMSCFTTPSTLCVGVDASGNVVTSTNPTGGVGAWTVTSADGANAFKAISCVPGASSTVLCVASDGSGNVVISNDPTDPSPVWTATKIDTTGGLPSVSCASTGFCVVGAGIEVFTSADPTNAVPTWNTVTISSANSSGMFCSPDTTSTSGFCASISSTGHVATATSTFATAGNWTVAQVDGANTYEAIACPSSTECVAGDDDGNISVTTNAGGSAESWSTSDVDGTNRIFGIACPSVSLCVAVDAAGNEITSTTPTTPGAGSWTVTHISSAGELSAVACPSTIECVAFDSSGSLYTATDVWTSPSSTNWTVTTGVDTGHIVQSVSCPSTTVCVAVDNGGNVISNANLGTASWTTLAVDTGGGHQLKSVSCPSTALCVAVDSTGDAVVSQNPTSASTGDWTVTLIGNGTNLTSVDCPSTTECFAADGGDNIWSSPTGLGATWGSMSAGPTTDFVNALACPSNSFCVAGSELGDIATGAITANTAQTITFTSTAPTSASVTGGGFYTPVTTDVGGSGYPIVISIDNASSSICAYNTSNHRVTYTANGQCIIDANQAGGVGWTVAPQAQQTFTIGGTAQTVSFTSGAPTGLVYPVSATYTPTATATSGLTAAITIDPSTTSVCSIVSNVVSFSAAGSCKIDANQAGGTVGPTTYGAATQVQQTVTIGQAAQSISFSSTAPPHAVATGATYSVVATGGGSGLPVTFTADGATTNGSCTVSGSTVSFVAAGTCVIDANQASNTDYTAALQAQQSFTVFAAGTQAITFSSGAPLDATVSGPTYTAAATSTSGLAVTLAVDSSATSICSINGSNVVTFTATGSCVLDASQAGGSGFAAAPQVQQSFTVFGAGTQAITFTSTAPAAATFGGTTYTPTASVGSGMTVTVAVDGTSSAVSAINGSNVVSFIGVGTCLLDANQSGGSGYSAAPQVQQSFLVGKAPQTILFTSSPSTPTFDGATYAVTATGGGSGNSVVVTVDATASAFCSLSGATITFTGAGGCVLDANQAGGTDYLAASQAQQSFTIAKASVVVTFTSTAPASATAGGATYVASATSTSSVGAVAITVDPLATAVCSITTSGVVSFVGSGTCVLDANQPTSTNYLAPAQVQQSFRVAAASNGSAPPPVGVSSANFGTPVSSTAVANQNTTVNETYSGAVSQVTVPAGALPVGTTVSTYPVTNPTSIAATIPSGQAYVLSFGVSWVTPTGTSPNATAPISMTITDPSIIAGDVIYQVSSSGLRNVGTATVNGIVTITFTSDPTFVVASVPHITISVLKGSIGAKGITVKVKCTVSASCRGSATLTVARKVKHGKKTEITHLVVAKSAISVAKGGAKSVVFKVTAAGKSVVASAAKNAKFPMTMVIVVTGAPRITKTIRV